MCMIDHADQITVLSDGILTARKPHRCGECHRVIEPGERYLRTTGVFDGFATYKTCLQCVAVREWLSQVCSGWIYTQVGEDLAEHFYEGYGMWLGRAVIGMRNHWRKRDGSLMQPMKLPEKMPVG